VNGYARGAVGASQWRLTSLRPSALSRHCFLQLQMQTSEPSCQWGEEALQQTVCCRSGQVLGRRTREGDVRWCRCNRDALIETEESWRGDWGGIEVAVARVGVGRANEGKRCRGRRRRDSLQKMLPTSFAANRAQSRARLSSPPILAPPSSTLRHDYSPHRARTRRPRTRKLCYHLLARSTAFASCQARFLEPSRPPRASGVVARLVCQLS
jgi:hypothetical protein